MKGNGLSRQAMISEIVQSMRRVFKAIHAYSRLALKEFGVTGPQLWMLRTLEEEGPLTVGDLADRMYLHISTASGVLDRLEERRLVRRRRAAEDRRVVWIELTAKGRTLLRNAPEPAQGRLLHGLERLGRRELARLYSSMKRIAQIMEAENIQATFFFEEP